MKLPILPLFVSAAILTTPPLFAQSKERIANVDERVKAEIDGLVTLYQALHRNPELSLREEQTAARLAKEMKGLGFEVTTGVGQTGIVCVFKNGEGPTILVRTDMDALPVIEQTGLDYASKVKVRDKSGTEVGVMHACGHDIHMTCWVGTAKVLTAMRDQWKGTLVFIGQPAEEIGAGARLMLADGLYERFPRPDFALALHADSKLPVGQIGYTDGLAMANVDTVEIIVRGKGGHGAAPHTTVDPIVLGAKIVLEFQTLIGREVDPLQPAVITVGSFHGGTKSNIIPNDAKLQVTVRTTTDAVRKQVLEGMERVVKGIAKTANAPEPSFIVEPNEFTPSLTNDKQLVKKTLPVLKAVLGEANVIERAPSMGGEDFSRYGRAGVPIFMYFVGTIDQPRFDAARAEGAKPLPSMHADSYYPTPKPSVEVGVRTMAMSVLNLLPAK